MAIAVISKNLTILYLVRLHAIYIFKTRQTYVHLGRTSCKHVYCPWGGATFSSPFISTLIFSLMAPETIDLSVRFSAGRMSISVWTEDRKHKKWKDTEELQSIRTFLLSDPINNTCNAADPRTVTCSESHHLTAMFHYKSDPGSDSKFKPGNVKMSNFSRVL